MATKIVTQILCDRCNREIKASEEAEADSTAAAEPIIYISRRGGEDIAFTDLCPKCEKRVGALVSDIGLLSSDEEADESEKKKKKTKAKAEVDEGEEDESSATDPGEEEDDEEMAAAAAN